MRQFDIIVWGATGFTGELVCEHVCRHYATSFRWAIAGRCKTKLESVCKRLKGLTSSDLDIPALTADLDDQETLERLAQQTKVLLSTAGPYAQLGRPVIRACIKARTHYADINGEIEWMRQTINEFHQPAMEADVKIVQCCGWDCAPADLGVLFLHDYARNHLNRKLCKVTNLVTEIAGAFSGGSLNTALGFYADPSKALFPHPYSLNPPGEREGPDGQQFLGLRREPFTGYFTSPSFFAPADMRIVRRSNHLLRNAYGKDFSFDEAFGHKSMWKALQETASVWVMGLFLLVVAHVPMLTRRLKAGSLKPGKGPSRQFMEAGHWRCDLIGQLDDSHQMPQIVQAVLKGKGDPGYLQTSRMLLEAGICLVRGESSPFCRKGGVLTPASGLGMSFIDRLKGAGITFDVLADKECSPPCKAA